MTLSQSIPLAATPLRGNRAYTPVAMNGGFDALGEEQLIQRMLNGGIQAFELLMGRYEARLRRTVIGIIKNPKDAEEVVQDVFLTVYQKISSFREEARFSTWIHRIAVNTALMRKRREKPGRSVPLEEVLEISEDWDSSEKTSICWVTEGKDQVLEEEAQQVIKAAVGQLEEKYQTVFVLRNMEGLSTEQTAQVTGLTQAAIKSRLHRARLHLRRELAGYFDEHAN
jgi:RNA polymerase sigma-70 factor (ECF subfamily)